MELPIYFNKVSNIFAENRLLKLAVVVLVVGYMYQGHRIDEALKYQRTIVLSPSMSSKLVFTGDKAPEAYLRDMARYISFLGLNYSSYNARGQFDEMLTLYDPEAAVEAKKALYSLADQVETAKLTSIFGMRKVLLGENLMEISGHLRIFKDDLKVVDEEVTYVLKYVVKDARFQITEFLPKRK